MLPLPSYLLAIGSSVICVMFIVSCLHWFVLVMCLSVFVISSHVLAFSSCRVLMLLPAVGESSLFMPHLFQAKSVSCQVKSSLSLFGLCLDVWISPCK